MYSNVGWTENLYHLASNWFFMDRRVNVEAFESLNDANNIVTEDTMLQRIDSAIRMIFDSVLHLKPFLISLILLFVVMIIVMACKRRIREIFVVLSAILLTAAILLYFSLRGRLLYRVSISVIVLFILPILFLTVKSFLVYIKHSFPVMVCIVMIGLCCYSVFHSNGLFHSTYDASNHVRRQEFYEIKNAMEHYVIEHSENFYIYDSSLAITGDALTVYSEGKPYNLTFWGGSGMYSPSYYD